VHKDVQPDKVLIILLTETPRLGDNVENGTESTGCEHRQIN